MWQPIVSTGAGRELRICRSFSRTDCQSLGSHLASLGESSVVVDVAGMLMSLFFSDVVVDLAGWMAGISAWTRFFVAFVFASVLSNFSFKELVGSAALLRVDRVEKNGED